MKKILIRIVSYLLFFSIISGIYANVYQYTTNENPKEHPILADNLIQNVVASNQADDWPMYGHDPAHTGVSLSAGPDTNQTLFTKRVEGSIVGVSAYNGKVYVATNGHLYCFNGITGETIFDSTNPDFNLFYKWGPPVIDDDRVYVGSDDGSIHCFDSSTGVQQWTCTIGSIASMPTLAYGNLYLANYSDLNYGMLCIETTNKAGDWDPCHIVWAYPKEVEGSLLCYTPAVADGKAYFGIYSFHENVYCVNALNGSFLWNYATDGEVDLAPCVSNGKVYVPVHPHPSGSQSSVYCLDAATGAFQWKIVINDGSSGSYIRGVPAIDNDKLYISTVKGFRCYNATSGAEIWVSPHIDEPISNPVIADGKIYYNGNMRLSCLNTETGSILWTYEYAMINLTEYPNLAISNGILYASDNTTLYAFEEPLGNRPPTTPIKPQGETQGNTDRTLLFSATTTDSDDDKISYLFDWGDNTQSEWTTPIQSGTAISASHQWMLVNTYQVKVKAKDIHGRESAWSDPLQVTITDTALNQLTLSVNPSTVPGGEDFIGTVTLKNTPVEGAIVEYAGTSQITDTSGTATFTASPVSHDTPYTITATYNDLSATTTITVLAQKSQESDNGWIFGWVRDTSGIPISDAQVCIRRTTSTLSDCVLTDKDGRYVRNLPIGTYILESSKTGYITKTKSDIQVTKNVATNRDFVLEQGQNPSGTTETMGYIDYTIEEKALVERTIGAQITITPSKHASTLYYSSDLTIELNTTQETVSFTISAENGTNGTIMVVRIGEGVLSDLDHLIVTYDGELLNETSNIKDFFDVKNNTSPSWLRVLTMTGLYIFVRVPHFSTHTITISSIIETFGGLSAIMIYAVIGVITVVLFVIPAFAGPYPAIYTRKKRRK